MGYYMTVRQEQLKGDISDLEHFLELPWHQNGDGTVSLSGGVFKWTEEFVTDLVHMSTRNVSGTITLVGEIGEYYRYYLDGDGQAALYLGKIEWADEPDEVYGTGTAGAESPDSRAAQESKDSGRNEK